MVKEILEIKEAAQWVLTEWQFRDFMQLIEAKAWSSARFYVADLTEQLEIKSIVDGEFDYTDLLSLQKLDSLLTDYVLNLNEEVDGVRKRRRIIRGAVSSE